MYNVLHSVLQRPPLRFSLEMALAISSAMSYLHSIGIQHRDLTSHNILLDEHGTPKISDFGLSRESAVASPGKLTLGAVCHPRWRPPEITTASLNVTEKCDVYSFTLVLWELLTGLVPFAELSGNEAAHQAAINGLRPLLPPDIDSRLRSLISRSWDGDQNNRPSFSDISAVLRAVIHS